ncbi:DUF6090 family protein [Gaetbulibacter aestuarii]|uniref:DUF6090 family protein n=1 Tax=Gaetbulibacter aestuarii TaxID=1502358 RepID=A0ABW7N4R4_9FLAO
MIKFFRQFRKKLISEGKTTNYLKYAFGEIILVVIGILIALQINNWNNDRQDANQELRILQDLENEYQENLNEVNEKIHMRDGMMTSIQRLFDYMDHGIENVPLDTIRIHMGRTFLLPTFNGTDGVTNEIINSGKLNLIQNTELKINLSNWSGTTEKVIEEEQLLVNQITPLYIDYLIHHFNLRKMGGTDQDDGFKNIWRLSNKRNSKFKPINGENDINEYKKFLSDTIISNLLVNIYSINRGANIQAYGLRDKTEHILAIIRSELKKKRHMKNS